MAAVVVGSAATAIDGVLRRSFLGLEQIFEDAERVSDLASSNCSCWISIGLAGWKCC